MAKFIVICEPKRGNREVLVSCIVVIEAKSGAAAIRAAKAEFPEWFAGGHSFKAPYAVPVKEKEVYVI